MEINLVIPIIHLKLLIRFVNSSVENNPDTTEKLSSYDKN